MQTVNSNVEVQSPTIRKIGIKKYNISNQIKLNIFQDYVLSSPTKLLVCASFYHPAEQQMLMGEQ